MDRMTKPLVTIFGGSGFIGTQIVQLLGRKDYRVRVAVRRPDLALHLRPLAKVGQVVPVQANVRYPESVARVLENTDIVINLVGIGHERGRQTFRDVHEQGARHIAEAAHAAGVKRLVHMSALGAHPESRSAYARSRAAGEAAVVAAYPEAVIMRPSIVFGKDDGFFNLLGSLLRLMPVFPLIGGDARFQPVFVGDVAEAFVRAADGEVPQGRVYELGGPEVETYREIVSRVMRETGRHRPLLPVSPGIGKLMALPFSLLPFPPLLTADQVELLSQDNVVSPDAMHEGRTLKAFPLVPTSMEAILPSYLWRFRRGGQFDKHVSHGATD